MVKKIRRMRTFARTAAKSLEKKLIENAKQLKKNPYLILPEYNDQYSTKHFNKIKKTLDKISRFSENPKKLEKLSNKRGLDGALAGSILLAYSEKAPYLAVAKHPLGDISYAQRGKADKEKLIAVQYFDNPILRLMGIKDVALKKRLHVYSWDNGYVSTGLKPNPPKDFINFIIKKTGLKYKDNVATCGDIEIEVARNKKPSKRNYLWIHWKSAGLIIAVCENCAKLRNTVFDITKYLIEPDVSDDFSIDVVGGVIKKGETGQQVHKINEYLSGEITDYDFIRANIKQWEKSIKESGEKILMLDGVSYGEDVDGFINALKPDEYEREGLKIMLEKVNEPVVFSNATPNKILEYLWESYGFDAIKSIIKDETVAEKFYSLDDTPSNILRLVFNYKERQKILSQLPRYKSLPTLAGFADEIARTYKGFGVKEALLVIKKRPDTPKGRSVAYAFLLALGKGEDKKWQYSQMEIEYGSFLKDYAKKLIEAKPNDYHKALKELLTASGVSEDIDKNLL